MGKSEAPEGSGVNSPCSTPRHYHNSAIKTLPMLGVQRGPNEPSVLVRGAQHSSMGPFSPAPVQASLSRGRCRL